MYIARNVSISQEKKLKSMAQKYIVSLCSSAEGNHGATCFYFSHQKDLMLFSWDIFYRNDLLK
jgi:hypothetical protein